MPEFKLDYHIHTDLSHDSETTVEEVLETAENSLDAIAITDHDGIKNSLKAAEKAPETLTVITGAEISTKQGHIIGLGIDELPEKNRNAWETAQEIREMDGVVIVPHPFQRFRHGLNRKTLEKVGPDAVETFNSRYILGLRNFQAYRYANKRQISQVSASDAHSKDMIGKAYTNVWTDKNQADELLRPIKNGETSIYGSKTPVRKFFSQLI